MSDRNLFILTRRQNRSNTMSDVQLLIKSPSYNEDFRLQLSLSATVKELKERIAQDHPSRPPAERQRLIFAGRLLQDTDVLKDILRLHDLSIPQTFHLVLKTEFTSGTNNNAPVTPPQQQPVYNQPFNQAPNPYLYQQRMQMHLGQGPYMMPGYAPQPGPNPYYNQYPPPGPYPGQYGPAYQQRVVVQGQVNPFQQMMMAQQQQQRRHVRVININLSLVFKLLLMVYVLSQGGTTQRTLFLAIGALFIYLYQTGLLPMRAVNIVPGVPQPPNNNVNNNNVPNNNNNAPNNNNNNDNNNNNNPVNNNNAVPNVANNNAAANNNGPNNNGPNNNVNNAPTNPNQPVPYRQPPGLWGELHGFFVPFFYSLFPNWNPDDIHGVLQQHMHDQDEGENPAAQLNR